jgi:hypothetical protein
VRGFGILIVVAACAAPESAAPTKLPGHKGPDCGHGALDADVHNCGECGHDCTKLPGVADATCFQGACRITCESGHAHCSANADDGCEADLTSKDSCGACGNVCAGVCMNGSCQSTCGPLTDCGGSCVDLTVDRDNCGGCGQLCGAPANGSATCDAGQCKLSCDSGYNLESGACIADPPPAMPSWTPVDSGSTETLYGVWGSPAGDIFVCGDHGTVLVALGGSFFIPLLSYTPNDNSAVWGVDSDHVLSVGWNNHDSKGAIFRPMSNGMWGGKGLFDHILSAAWGSDFDHVFIVGGSGIILHATDGYTWADESGATTEHLWGVWGSAESDVYAVGSQGVVLHEKSGAWAIEPSGGTTTLYGTWGASATDIWAVGSGGLILHSAGDGKWTAETSGTTQTLFNVSGFGSDVWAVGAAGTILHRSAGSWTSEPSNTTNDLYGVWASASGVYAVGDGGAIVYR